MKTIKILILVLFASLSSFAQDPQLFENDWYLQKITIDDIDYFPPSNNEINNIALSIQENNYFITNVCDAISGDFITITNDNINILYFIIIDTGECVLEESLTFQDNYFNTFFNWKAESNSFNYNIEIGDLNNKILTLTNLNGDKAIYNSLLLSNQNFNKPSANLYPNPIKTSFQINTPENIAINHIEIYDALGRKVLVSENTSTLDVSNLTSGLFFVHIITNQGTLVKKVIKE